MIYSPIISTPSSTHIERISDNSFQKNYTYSDKNKIFTLKTIEQQKFSNSDKLDTYKYQSFFSNYEQSDVNLKNKSEILTPKTTKKLSTEMLSKDFQKQYQK